MTSIANTVAASGVPNSAAKPAAMPVSYTHLVALRRNEYLCLVGQPPERLGVNEAVPVALEAGAVRAFLHRPLPAPGSVGLCCPIGQGQPFPFLLLFTNSHTLHSPCLNCLYNKNTRWNCVFLFLFKIFFRKIQAAGALSDSPAHEFGVHHLGVDRTCSSPVSYTHLVQVLNPVDHTQALLIMPEPERADLVPVSYTHLDVYKRQMLSLCTIL